MADSLKSVCIHIIYVNIDLKQVKKVSSSFEGYGVCSVL